MGVVRSTPQEVTAGQRLWKTFHRFVVVSLLFASVLGQQNYEDNKGAAFVLPDPK